MICLDESPTTQKNAALVVTYKTKSGEDALPVYRDQLARPRVLQQGDLSTPSVPKGVRDLNINGLPWVEGIHLGSEMANYYTHYYASAAYGKAILVSISVEESAHDQMMSVLQPTINSFKFLNLSGSNDGKASEGSTHNQAHAPGGSGFLASGDPSKIMTVMGFRIHRNYVFLGVGLILVLGMMAYAILMD